MDYPINFFKQFVLLIFLFSITIIFPPIEMIPFKYYVNDFNNHLMNRHLYTKLIKHRDRKRENVIYLGTLFNRLSDILILHIHITKGETEFYLLFMFTDKEITKQYQR
jgi:hypothetical protein